MDGVVDVYVALLGLGGVVAAAFWKLLSKLNSVSEKDAKLVELLHNIAVAVKEDGVRSRDEHQRIIMAQEASEARLQTLLNDCERRNETAHAKFLASIVRIETIVSNGGKP